MERFPLQLGVVLVYYFCLSACLPAYLSAYLSACLPVCLPVCLSTCLPAYINVDYLYLPRICLARCVYKEADVYLLDDPLSSVDANVGRQIFQQCVQVGG